MALRMKIFVPETSWAICNLDVRCIETGLAWRRDISQICSGVSLDDDFWIARWASQDLCHWHHRAGPYLCAVSKWPNHHHNLPRRRQMPKMWPNQANISTLGLTWHWRKCEDASSDTFKCRTCRFVKSWRLQHRLRGFPGWHLRCGTGVEPRPFVPIWFKLTVALE